jgi:hypothetical protein
MKYTRRSMPGREQGAKLNLLGWLGWERWCRRRQRDQADHQQQCCCRGGRSGRKKTRVVEMGSGGQVARYLVGIGVRGFPDGFDNDDGRLTGPGITRLSLGFPYSRAFTISAKNRINVAVNDKRTGLRKP